MPGKSRGRHPHKALTDKFIRGNLAPGRYADGNGLYLLVDKSGNRRWLLRTLNKATGKRCDLGLGGLCTVSLKEAREKAIEWRKVARSGVDPIQERRRANRTVPTFAKAARTVHEAHSGSWKNKKHAAQWIKTLETYAFPLLENMPVNQIGSPEVSAVLSPIWLEKPETARRVRQRIGTVLDWAKTQGHRSGDNPVTGVSRGLPKQPKGQKHFAALPYDEIPGFIQELRVSNSSIPTKLALEFLILTATRTGEVRLAQWSEIDFEDKSWTIPAVRTKPGRAFRVPLSPRCIDLLTEARDISGDDKYIFPGQKAGNPLSDAVFLQVLKRMGKRCTGHGFRSSFRDWANEKTNFSREVCEMAMSHTVSDKTEAAYLRGDLFEKRRDLMETWSRYATTDPSDKVVILRASGTA
jgi:integrase